MTELFRTGDGSVTDKITVALELVDNDWFRRNFIHALELMCEQFNWEQSGDASVDFARDKSNEMLESVVFEVDISGVPVGAVQMWLTDTPPAKWLVLNGSQVSRATYAALFALWGTFFGSGDGSTTFNLPDMRSLHPKGVGGLIDVGEINGSSVYNLTVGQLPPHSHGVNDPGHNHAPGSPLNNFFGQRTSGIAGVNNGSTYGLVATTTTNGTGITLQNTGLGDPLSINLPSMGVHYIAYAGV